MLIAFHSGSICERGADVAMYDYAHYNETLLGNRSIIVTSAKPENCQPQALQRFRDRFEVVHYKPSDDLENGVLKPLGVDVFYTAKPGRNDGLETKHIHCCIHVVFKHNEPHGHVYAYVSEWLARKAAGEAGKWVPHIVHAPADAGDLRDALGIPRDAIVFGRHGGSTTFNIGWAQAAVFKVARRRPDVHFVFLNTDLPKPRFRAFPSNIHCLPTTTDPKARSQFINSCDAMLHARRQGETFGLACAEFSAHNKPVITCSFGRELAHIEVLGSSAIAYSNKRQLVRILMGFRPDPGARWDVVTSTYSPENVMRRFDDVFLPH